jgi:methylmalonyl-CoA mutase
VAALGSPAAHGARVSFARNLLAAGGIETVVADPAGAAGTVVCVCGTDKAYAEQAEDVAATLRDRGVAHVWLAGKPASYAGVDAYLCTGCDAVDVLTTMLTQLGVAR